MPSWVMAATTADVILDLIEARRRDQVASSVLELCRSDGIDAAVAVLAAVQLEVGARWQAQRWTVADEHAASAIIDHALSSACLGLSSRTQGRPVVVACVEDEWHVLPARMLSEQLRSRRWDALFLGASSPAGELGRFTADVAPVAVVLSCSMPMHLPGARRSVEACHDAGVPVVVGGGAFGGPARAAAIGADRWCADVSELHDTLIEWALERPALASPTVEPPKPVTTSQRRLVLDLAARAVFERVPPLAEAPLHEQDRVRDDLEALLCSAEASAHGGDPGIFRDQVAWQSSVSHARGEPDGLVDVLVQALRGALPAGSPLAGQLPVET